jgi:hypothetical protein
MIVYWHEIWRAVLFILTFISGKTVLEKISKLPLWLYEQRQKRDDERVLSTFREDKADGPWHSGHGVSGHLGLKAAFGDMRGYLPLKSGTKWHQCLHWVMVYPYRLRHTFRRVLLIPSPEKADKILWGLYKRGLLIRAGWSNTKQEFYRLRD